MYLITIIDKLREAEYPIDNVITYNENNDPNKLLGRPGQYIEKVNFADLRLYQSDKNNPAGGSIEIFENEKDCQNRVDYLKKVSQESPFIEYNCMYDNILLRLNEKLTSDEAQSYIIAVQNIIEGKDIEKCIISSENTSSIFVYFSDSLSDDEITKLGEKLKKLSDIMDVEYTSAYSVWKEYCKTYLGVENDDLAEGFFHDSPLISSYYNVTVLMEMQIKFL